MEWPIKIPGVEYYYVDDYAAVIHGDCIEAMKMIPDGSVNLIATSPPYNLKNSTGNGMKSTSPGGTWANPYVSWQRDCLHEMMRIIPDDGAIFYNHKWRVQNGLLQDRQDIVQGFPVRQVIIWKRPGGINFNTGYFVPTYEVIYLIAKPEFKLAPKASSHGDVWEFTQESNNRHPAPFPLDLIKRIISSTTAKTVLDPFMGSGTTLEAAKSLNRHCIGIELSEEYCEIAVQRLQQEVFAF
tara:strand:- start:77 stop:796 length:720 start_codon:yes stop_codon:yes gene_type:complete